MIIVDRLGAYKSKLILDKQECMKNDKVSVDGH